MKEELKRTKEQYNQYKEDLRKVRHQMDIYQQNNNKLLSLNHNLFMELEEERSEFKDDLTKLLTLLFQSMEDSTNKIADLLNKLFENVKLLESDKMELLCFPNNFDRIIPFLVEKISLNRILKQRFFNLLKAYNKGNVKKESKKEQLIKYFQDRLEEKSRSIESKCLSDEQDDIKLISNNDQQFQFKLTKELSKEKVNGRSKSTELRSKFYAKNNTGLSIRSTEQAESEFNNKNLKQMNKFK